MTAFSSAVVQSALIGATTAAAQAVPCADLGNTADPPPEVFEILGERGLSRDEVEDLGWYARPKLFENRKGRTEEVDAQALMEPLLEERALVGTLRTMDVFNGCRTQCDTCLADAPLPTKFFSYDSLSRLFSDSRFIRMLQSKSFRIGSVGDLFDHPRGVEIAEMILRSTSPSELGLLRLFVNYRKRKEEQFDRLLTLAKANPERLKITISLPLNRDYTVRSTFDVYCESRNDFFDSVWREKGWNSPKFDNVSIHDVSKLNFIFMTGRVLPDSFLDGSIDPEVRFFPNERGYPHRSRGLVKTFLNPDALWLKAYATVYESYTSNAFTPITNSSLSFLQYLKYHPDFQTPPNWLGGSGVKKRHRDIDIDKSRPAKRPRIRE